MFSRAIIVSAVLAIACSASACGGVVEERVVVRHPTVTEQAVVYDAPPPDRVEVITASPGRDYVWERGRWERHGRQWVWAGGHWRR